ncbi:hypothetical protein K461DRAFT_279422 [Myriangium duriaei CBS 260.36]|uniref:Uncharacterized protein n=1 Tax=Myriangium duriaei CBS 260.36 TaxID=1168546 RepID=A0A9P4J3W5_9PEZI|nr:hypothetical protein K461DRAFT_279422 [Myriangium duriaei CBS 260.36]
MTICWRLGQVTISRRLHHSLRSIGSRPPSTSRFPPLCPLAGSRGKIFSLTFTPEALF